MGAPNGMSSGGMESINDRNPNPFDFKIVRYFEKSGNLVVQVNYPNCDNYEGNKIILFKRLTIEKLKAWKSLDPHFLENNPKSPAARFEPTKRGWELACLNASWVHLTLKG